MVEYIKLNEIEKQESSGKNEKIFNKKTKFNKKKIILDIGKKNLVNQDKKIFSFKKLFWLFIGVILIISIIDSLVILFSPKIAVIPIKGVIMSQESNPLYGQSSISSRKIAKTIYQLKDDNSVKAILLDINSPGGSPVASDEISKAIEETKKIKPVYSLIEDMGASGAFWIAVSSNKIYASSMSTVGSIGVTSAGLSFENFIKRYNITYRKQTAGKYKDMGSPYRKETEEEKKIIQNILNDIHKRFIEHVAKSRNLSIQNVTKYATGQIFLGDKAKQIGFIDEIGYYPDVIKKLKNISNSSETIVVTYGDEPSLLQIIGIDLKTDFSPNNLIMLE